MLSRCYLEKGMQTPLAQGRSTHFNDGVDTDQQVINKDLSLCCSASPHGMSAAVFSLETFPHRVAKEERYYTWAA